jgi:hypothetical protein
VPVVVMGLGHIGQEVARAALASEEVTLVGAVDSHPRLSGQKLVDVLGDPAAGQLRVSADLGGVSGVEGGVLLLCTGSRLPQVMDQILGAVQRGLHVVSSCEELAFPWMSHPDLAETLESAAEAAGVAILGTGVNPGFVLDRLVATLGQVAGTVRHVRADRVVDARTRREALQRKIGAGLTEDEFDALAAKDGVGHVGLLESAALTALGLGLDCDDFEEELSAVIAEEDILGGAFPVAKGKVAGMAQTVVGLSDGQEKVRLELVIALGADSPGDRVRLDADVSLDLEIRGGVAGDRATANALVNAAPRVAAAEPGLLTVLELPAGR